MRQSNKQGRPPWSVTKSALLKVESLASQGLSNEEIAGCLGISRSTLYAKMGEFPDFSDAIKKGKALGIATATAALMDRIKEGNIAATIFFLKCKAGWRENSQLQQETKQSDSVHAAIHSALERIARSDN